MADDTQRQDTAEEQAQQPPMPSGDEQKGQEEDSSQQPAQETGDSVEAPAGDSENLGLPDDSSDRTREQFEKLKQQLREAKAAAYRTQQEPKTQPVEKLYDETTGLVNIKALEDLQQRTINAEKELQNMKASSEKTARDNETRDLFSAYPELKNPKTKEAKELFDESERIWMHSQAYPEKYGGMPLSQKQAADIAKTKMGGSKQPVKEDAQAAEAKEQASAGATGRPTQGVQESAQSEEVLEQQRLGTRVGDRASMVARMRAIRESK